MKKAIIFDMDGVLIQSEMVYRERRNIFFEKHQLPNDEEFQQKVIGSNPKAMFEMIFPNDKDKQLNYLAKYHAFREEYQIDFVKILTENVREVLEWLKENQFRIALASAGEKESVLTVLELTNLYSFFEVVVSGNDMKQSKPAPDVYLEAMNQLGLPADECLAVEDSTYGIQAATAAGLECLALKPKDYDVDQSLATKIIYSLNEIPDWLLR